MPMAAPHAHAETPTAHSDAPHVCFGQIECRLRVSREDGCTSGLSSGVLLSINASVFALILNGNARQFFFLDTPGKDKRNNYDALIVQPLRNIGKSS